MKIIVSSLLLVSITVSGAPKDPGPIASDCLERELDLWEKQRGRLPTSEEADLLIEACVKEAFKKEPKNESKFR